MTSPKPSEHFNLERDLPTCTADIRAQREHRPQVGTDWLEQITQLEAQVPEVPRDLIRRFTFAGCVAFELDAPTRRKSIAGN
jgi:hypothetical protein